MLVKYCYFSSLQFCCAAGCNFWNVPCSVVSQMTQTGAWQNFQCSSQCSCRTGGEHTGVVSTECWLYLCPGEKDERRQREPLNPFDAFSVPGRGQPGPAEAAVSPPRRPAAVGLRAAAGERILLRRAPCKAA